MTRKEVIEVNVIACILAIIIGYMVIFFAGYETIRATFYAIAVMGYFILKKLDNIGKDLKSKEEEKKND